MSFNVILWEESVEVGKVFLMEKRINRFKFTLKYKKSCRPYFKEHIIMTETPINVHKIACYIYENKSLLVY